jgi:hypothetical protein
MGHREFDYKKTLDQYPMIPIQLTPHLITLELTQFGEGNTGIGVQGGRSSPCTFSRNRLPSTAQRINISSRPITVMAAAISMFCSGLYG